MSADHCFRLRAGAPTEDWFAQSRGGLEPFGQRVLAPRGDLDDLEGRAGAIKIELAVGHERRGA